GRCDEEALATVQVPQRTSGEHEDANVSVYASMIHWRPETPDPRSRWIVGRTTLTTRLSSMGMNSPNTMATSTHHRRRSGASVGAAAGALWIVFAMRSPPRGASSSSPG